LVGDGPLRGEIEDLVKRHRLEGCVHLVGWRSNAEVRDLITESRALVLPSFAEGLPVVIMEAMALRRPVITTFVAGIPELVRDVDNGWLVPAGDVNALAGAMIACLAAPADALARMGEAAHDRVLARHDADTEAAKLAGLFAASTAARAVPRPATAEAEAR
jgi:glycosyltransferase involved in cell wall biosynthesis